MKRSVFLTLFLINFAFPLQYAHAYINDMWNLIIDEGETVSLSGYHKYFTKVEIAGTLNIDPPEVPLVLEAPYIIIQPTGKINGNGKGYLEGPGKGGMHVSCSGGYVGIYAGGGGYGGEGGNGCCSKFPYDAIEDYGSGGKTYGTSDGFDIDMGSGGDAWTPYYLPRYGGGCVNLTGYNSVTISGVVSVNGGDAGIDEESGGSGGGIKITAPVILFRGLLSAKGGRGDDMELYASSGGGGGGRIKLFYTVAYHNLGGTFNVAGGRAVESYYCYHHGVDGTIHIEELVEMPTITPTPTNTLASPLTPTPTFTPTYAVVGLKWFYPLPSLNESSPAIGLDGSIYVVTHDEIVSFDPDGSVRWSQPVYLASEYGIAVGPDGTIYAENRNNLYSFNPDGSKNWEYDLGGSSIHTVPAIGADGTIYLGRLRFLTAIDPTIPDIKWESSTEIAKIIPSIDFAGTIYTGIDAGTTLSYLYAVNPDGSIKWKSDIDNYIYVSPAIGVDGTIYIHFGGGALKLYAINPDGTVRWTFPMFYNRNSPAIGTDGTIYTSDNRYCYAINPDGTLKWKFSTGASYASSPVIGKNGVIYFGACNDFLYAVNPDGTLKWKYKTGECSGPPVIGDDGTIYISADGKGLYALYSDSFGLADSAWPRYRHDNQNTGRSTHPVVPVIDSHMGWIPLLLLILFTLVVIFFPCLNLD